MAMMNVDPEKQSDPFYRYKMQRVATKIEGNGNGIKTVVPNIIEIADRLGRDVECLMKYFAHELAVTTKFKDEKWIMTGSFQQDTVQQCLFDFIKKFVLCKQCRNPETTLQLDEKKDIWLCCKACSSVTPIDPKEKLCNLLVRKCSVCSGPVKADKAKKDKASEKATAAPTKTKDEKQEEKFQKETRHAKNEDIIDIEKEELPNPVDVLKNFMAGVEMEAPPKEADIINKVFDMKNDYGLTDKMVVALVFETLFDSNIIKEIEPKYRLFRRFLKPETEVEVIINIMLLCSDEVSLKPKFAIILKKLYDCDVISESCIIDWFNAPYKKSTSGGVDKETVKFFKEKSQPFIDWLGEAEDDDDDEEEEEPVKPGTKAAANGGASPKAAVAATHAAGKEAGRSIKDNEEEEINIDEI